MARPNTAMASTPADQSRKNRMPSRGGQGSSEGGTIGVSSVIGRRVVSQPISAPWTTERGHPPREYSSGGEFNGQPEARVSRIGDCPNVHTRRQLLCDPLGP